MNSAHTSPGRHWSLIGPGLIAAATGVGARDLVATLVAGSHYGYQLIWAAVLDCLLRIVLVKGVGCWTCRRCWPHAMTNGGQ